MASPTDTVIQATLCVICYSPIDSTPICSAEEELRLKCNHVFHRECIGEWLKQKHSCPVCRNRVEGVITPEARFPEMTFADIVELPDHLTFEASSYAPPPPPPPPQGRLTSVQINRSVSAIALHHLELLLSVRINALINRMIRRLKPNENNPLSYVAAQSYRAARNILIGSYRNRNRLARLLNSHMIGGLSFTPSKL